MSVSSIAVIGAGPAGLAAAFRLRQQGHTVRLFEATARPGSKLSSEARGGFVLDRGAYFIPTTHTEFLALAREAGLNGELVPGGFVFSVVRGGHFHRIDGADLVGSFRRTRLLSGWAKLAAVKLVPEVPRSRRARIARITEAGRYDIESLATWATRTQHPEIVNCIVDPLMRSSYGVEIANISRVEFLNAVALFGGAKLVAFKEGMNYYARQLASHVDVTLGAHVTAVEPTADGVTVTWTAAAGEQSANFGGCVIALAARDAAAILPRLDDWRAAYLRRVPSGALLLPNVAISRPPIETDTTYAMIGRSEHPFLAGIVFNSNKAPDRVPPGKELLTLTLTTEWCEQHKHQPDDEIAAAAIEAAEHFLPAFAGEVEFTDVARWTQQYPPVGHYAALGEFRLRSATDTTIQLCGEYHSAPHLSAATASGERAAQAILSHL